MQQALAMERRQLLHVAGCALLATLGLYIAIINVLPSRFLANFGGGAAYQARVLGGLLLIGVAGTLFLRLSTAVGWGRAGLTNVGLLVLLPVALLLIQYGVLLADMLRLDFVDTLEFRAGLLLLLISVALNSARRVAAWRRLVFAALAGCVVLVLGEALSWVNPPAITGLIGVRIWLYVPLVWLIVTWIADTRPVVHH